MSQQNLSPDEQDKLFALLQKSGAVSQDVGQSTNTPDAEAQQGIGNVDFSTLQSLIKHAANPHAVPMQEGDTIHPMDAIQQISGQMFGPAKPSGIESTGGPQIQQSPQGTLSARIPASNWISKKLGIKKDVPVSNANYYQSAKNAGVDKFLPTGLAQMPDGTPYVDKESYDQAMKTGAYGLKATAAESKVITTLPELTARGIPSEDGVLMLKAQPNGITEKFLSDYGSMKTLGIKDRMVNALVERAGAVKLATAARVGGIDGLQQTAAAATKNLGLIMRAKQLVQQIEDGGGAAIQSQRAELAAVLGQVAGQNNGVLTDEKMNMFMPQSAKGKFGNWSSYWTNENQPIDFTGYLPQIKDLLFREEGATKTIANAGTAPGLALLASQYPDLAEVIQKSRKVNPLVGTPPPPKDAPQPSNGKWRVIR